MPHMPSVPHVQMPKPPTMPAMPAVTLPAAGALPSANLLMTVILCLVSFLLGGVTVFFVLKP